MSNEKPHPGKPDEIPPVDRPIQPLDTPPGGDPPPPPPRPSKP